MSKSPFIRRLKKLNPKSRKRRWIFVPYDQLSDEIGPLADDDPGDLGIILIENPWKASRRPYHKQKLAWILTSMRHFALEQADRGVAVRYLAGDGPYRQTLRKAASDLETTFELMEPAERELRVDLQPLVEEGLLELLPHEGWLTLEEDFKKSQKGKKNWRMDSFYRHVRRRTGALMEDGKPEGGKYSFDPENRERWEGDPPAPELPQFKVDEVSREVGDLIKEHFGRHPGSLQLEAIPARLEDVEAFWKWVREKCLPHFGPYEDAMSIRSTNLFHSRLSTLINLHRLLPERVLDEVLEMDLPLQSKEGFVRQLLGWREFMRHVHRQTDGFREMPGEEPRVAAQPGDGGYQSWKGEPWKRKQLEDEPDGGAQPSFLGAEQPLPQAFWGTESGLFCLDHVAATVWDEAFSHHITRLMVLSNIATLLDIDPRQLTDWFWVAYSDAFDWVVEPNVLGMGTFALGPLFTTKPYVSGAAYINRMSDYCEECSFDPKKNCPITRLYWAFLARHREQLEKNPRLRMIYGSLKKRSSKDKKKDEDVFERVQESLRQGDSLNPDDF